MICSWVSTENSLVSILRPRVCVTSRVSAGIAAVDGASTNSASSTSVPNSRCAAVTGISTWLSRSGPNALPPTGARTPATRNRTPATVIVRPSGSRSPNSVRAMPSPSTTTRRPVTTSDSLNPSPRARSRDATFRNVSVTPRTVARDRSPLARTPSLETR